MEIPALGHVLLHHNRAHAHVMQVLAAMQVQRHIHPNGFSMTPPPWHRVRELLPCPKAHKRSNHHERLLLHPMPWPFPLNIHFLPY